MQNTNKPAVIQPSRSCWKRVISVQNWKVILTLILLTGVLSYPIYNIRVHTPVDGDYGSHIGFAIEFLQTRVLNPAIVSHPVLHIFLAFLYWLTRSRLDLYTAMLLIQIVVQISIALILYFWIGSAENRKHWDWLRAAISVSFPFLGPILIPALWDHKLYFGYIGLSNYHNPTIHMLKPLALLSMMYAIRCLKGGASSWGSVLLSAFLVSLSAWIKPSYVLAVLPGLGLAVLIRLFQKQKVDWRLIWGGFAIPGVISLGIQWFITYRLGYTGSGIILAPFQMESAFSDWLLLKFLLSSLFPLVILWMARKWLTRDSALLAGWTVFLAGVAQNYLLAEGGERFYHGNFRWSGQIVLFLLFAVTMQWLLREKILPNRALLWEKAASLGAYAAHLAGGITYYVYCILSIHYH